MTTLYTLQNQYGYFLQKKSTEQKSADKISTSLYMWGDGQELNKLFRTTHKDEAINMMFEAGSQDVALRISIKEYPANTKGLPTIPTDDMPAPLPKATIEIVDTSDEDIENRAERSEHDTHATAEQKD